VRLLIAIFIVTLCGAATAESVTVPVPSISSDVWLRTGPSTSHPRISGLPRGTAVVEIVGPGEAFEPLSDRWVRVFVLEGRSAGREGWVWGDYVGCCTPHDWLD
jgi:uncharacterized protein YraI